jgi:TonB-dependent starch-binding outer membrane protein SusC
MVIKPPTFRKLVLLTFALCIGLMAHAQARIIQGQVSDNKGELLAGASVSVPGTTIGAFTDADGKYSLNVPQGTTTLQFSMIGYKPVTETIGERTTVNVVMEEQTTNLDEIVVIGYGTVKKRDLTGSVASIKAEDVANIASSNALQAIQGKVAGLDITKSSGATGSSVNMTLRGVRSVNAGNAPLFLVDGVEYGSTLDINPSDIASYEVLKDASSTAIYGTRGANGVIIITTKSGAAAGAKKAMVSFNSYVSFNNVTNLPKVMSAQQEYLFQVEKKRFAAEDVANTWGSTSLSDYSPETVFSNVITSPWEKSVYQLYKEGGVDWYKMMLHQGVSQNYELSVNGASDKTSYNFSLGYMDENGILKNDELKRYNLRVGIDQKISDKLKAGVNVLFTYKNWDKRNDDVYSQLIKMHSLAQPYLADGTILDKPSELSQSHTNPLLNEVPGFYANNVLSTRLFGNAYINWEIIKGLTFRSVLGVDVTSSRDGEYEDYMCSGIYQSGKGSYLDNTNSSGSSFTWSNTLNYAFKLGEIQNIELLAGQEARKSILESHEVSGFGLQDHYGTNSFYYLSNIVSTGRQLDDIYSEQAMLSYFGRVNYRLLGKYLLTATLRTDGASVLAEGNKWDYFPSVAASWNISDEGFMKDNNVIDNMKIRASWGVAGNSSVSPYMTRTSLGKDQVYYTFGSLIYSSMVPAVLGNSDVTWEKTGTYDAGLDISLFRERVTGTFDVYYSKTTGLLIYKGLPASSVYPQVLANVGETENKGFEAAIGLKAIQKKDFSWNIDFTYSMNKDKLVSLASGETQNVSNPDQALIVGKPVQSFYNYEADGCWKIDEAVTAATYSKVPGDVKIRDLKIDGVINEYDKRVYSKNPKFILGMTNTFTYKAISLSAQLYARVGQWIQYSYNTAYKPTEPDGSSAVDFWTPENQNAKFPRPGISSQNDFPALSFENASFVKIKEVTLSYLVPNKYTEKIGLSKLRVYGSLQNYFTFSNLDNYDPERGGSISDPMTKQAVFGINVDF